VGNILQVRAVGSGLVWNRFYTLRLWALALRGNKFCRLRLWALVLREINSTGLGCGHWYCVEQVLQVGVVGAGIA
jgi:hypothetical protein